MIEVPSDKLYHFIWGFDKSHSECLINGNFKIVPIDKSPVVSYLNGDTKEYLSQSHLFVVRENSIKYLFERFKLGEKFKINAVEYNGKYIISDGMHRSSIMFVNGVTNYEINLVTCKTNPSDAIFEPFLNDDKFIL